MARYVQYKCPVCERQFHNWQCSPYPPPPGHAIVCRQCRKSMDEREEEARLAYKRRCRDVGAIAFVVAIALLMACLAYLGGR